MAGTITAVVHGPTASVKLLVDFTGDAAAANATTVTVTRSSKATPAMPAAARPVRSLDQIPAPGGVTYGWDHEPPLGVALTYVATAAAVDGTVLATTPAVPLRMPELEPGTVWLKSLINPTSSARFVVRDLPEWSDESFGSLSRPVGSRLAAAAIDTRGGVSGSITLKTETAVQRAALDALLALSEPVYLLQFAPAAEEADRYVWIGTRKRRRAQRWEGASLRWLDLDLVEVMAPPTAGASIVIPGERWDAASAATFDTVTPSRFVDGLT